VTEKSSERELQVQMGRDEAIYRECILPISVVCTGSFAKCRFC